MKNRFQTLLFVGMMFSTWLWGGFSGAMKQQQFLEPEKAFQVSAIQKQNHLLVRIQMADAIHLYEDTLHFTLLTPQKIPLHPTLPPPKIVEGDKVYAGLLEVDISLEPLLEKLKGEYSLTVTFQGCSDAGICYQPILKRFTFQAKGERGFFEKMGTLVQSGNTDKIADALAQESSLFILLLFFIAGLLMALTPCILPMIPILSSIILQQANQEGEVKKSHALLISFVYVISMALMYALIGVVAGLLDFDLQANLNNPWVIVPMAGIFFALALSLFGYFELSLPRTWQERLDGMSSKANAHGSLVGTAIMGALSALIVGACTAPIISGAILFIMLTGKALLGGVALFFMGLGAGVPLLLVGAGASHFIPKPGGWMNRVSKFFGLLMLVMALLMLSRLLPTEHEGDKGYSIARLMQEVQKSDKPVIVDLYKAGCASCKELEEITFPHPDVRKALEGFTFIHIDVTDYTPEDKALLKKYHLFGAPNMLFFDRSNHYLKEKTLTGFIAPEKMVQHLKSIEP